MVGYAAGSVTNEYDGNGLRVRRTKQGGTDVAYVIAGTQPIAEYVAGTASANPSVEYVYLGSQLIASKSSTTYTFYASDHLSIRGILSDANPNSPSEQGHWPFGESWYGSSNKWKFTSYERDSDVGDDFAVMRRYQFNNGRFSSPDPAGLAAVKSTNPQSWNRYAYVGNGPISTVDPLGLAGRDRPRPVKIDEAVLDKCIINGATDMPCALAYDLIFGGAAEACPNNVCRMWDGHQFVDFVASADGSSGYLPFGLAGFSVKDIAALRLEPHRDCSTVGYRNIAYEVNGPSSSDPGGWYVTEHQDPKYWAKGPDGTSTDVIPGGFDDIIFGWKIENSRQDFTISRQGSQQASWDSVRVHYCPPWWAGLWHTRAMARRYERKDFYPRKFFRMGTMRVRRHPYHWFKLGLLVLGTAALVLSVTITAYGMYLRRSAAALITSAEQIHSAADARKWIGAAQRAARNYTETSSPDGLGRAHKVELSNSLLSSLRLVPSTGMFMQVSTRSGALDTLVVGIYTNNASVWLQEEFTAGDAEKDHLDIQRAESGQPLKAIFTFSDKLDPAKRKAIFDLDVNCLVKLGGCTNAEEILPALSQQEPADILRK